MTQSNITVKARFQAALDTFVATVRADGYIIAAILAGSLSHDEVWAKSDIDMVLICRNEKLGQRMYCLVEDGINIHAWLIGRGEFKRQIERALQSSFLHSYIAKSTLLFTTDETIRQYFAQAQHLGDHDRAVQLLRYAARAVPVLAKAEKWLRVKGDPAYSFLWMMYAVDSLAAIEVIARGEITGREVIQQALRHNPTFFNAVYRDLIAQPADAAAVARALGLMNGYLRERATTLFAPVLEHLAEAGGPRTVSELDLYFAKRAQIDSLASAYEWLAGEGIVQQVGVPLRLTEKSRVAVNEAAYYYDPAGAGSAEEER